MLFNKRKFENSYCYDARYNVNKISSSLEFLLDAGIDIVENEMTINYTDENSMFLHNNNSSIINCVNITMNDRENTVTITERLSSIENNMEDVGKIIEYRVENNILNKYITSYFTIDNEEDSLSPYNDIKDTNVIPLCVVPQDYNVVDGLSKGISYFNNNKEENKTYRRR